jgi:hypothetical protein
MDFLNLFSNGKSGGPGPRRVDQAAQLGSTVDRGSADRRVRRRLAGARCASARAHRGSPAALEEDKPDKVLPEGCSPEHEWWRRGGATEAKNGGGLISA